MAKEVFKFSGARAINYDTYLGPFLFEPYGREMAGLLPSEGIGSVLEIAGGTGRVTRHLRDRLPASVKLTASDLSPDMLEVAREKLKDKSGIDWTVADMQALPFPSNSFDVVVCQFGIMFLPDKRKGFDEVYRVLKPGGRFLFSTWERTEAVGIFNLVFDAHIIPFFKGENPANFKVPFSLFDPAQLKGFLLESQFHHDSIKHVTLVGVSPSARDIVMGFFVTHAIGQEVKDRDPEAFESIAQRMEKNIAEKFGDNPVACDLTALFGSGQKK